MFLTHLFDRVLSKLATLSTYIEMFISASQTLIPPIHLPPEIVERVRTPVNDEPLRPDTLPLCCSDFKVKLMVECWSEEVDLRPDFKLIRIKLKPMQQGL